MTRSKLLFLRISQRWSSAFRHRAGASREGVDAVRLLPPSGLLQAHSETPPRRESNRAAKRLCKLHIQLLVFGRTKLRVRRF